MPASEEPWAAHVVTHEATVMLLLVKLYPVRARAALSDTHPSGVHPAGTLFVGNCGGLELTKSVRRIGPPQISLPGTFLLQHG